jgi:hypothetical protein
MCNVQRATSVWLMNPSNVGDLAHGYLVSGIWILFSFREIVFISFFFEEMKKKKTSSR